MAKRGFFLTVEGIDGAGKSTQAQRLAERLRALGHSVIETREPGGAPGAEEIRKLLVEGAPGRWSAETETLLFTAARRDHVERTVEPALAAGSIVICDRYVDSTRAYQGAGAVELRQVVDRLHALAIRLDPDLTLIFDLDAGAGLSRTDARANGAAENRFEQKGAAFQARLRQEFLAIAEAEPERCVVIDAAAAPDAVADKVWEAVAPRLGLTP
ncbi:MAG: dTMP kinase [Paracoccaceae bacterium]|nr:dTMP kinase [Paracoccaceae bacterium]